MIWAFRNSFWYIIKIHIIFENCLFLASLWQYEEETPICVCSLYPCCANHLYWQMKNEACLACAAAEGKGLDHDEKLPLTFCKRRNHFNIAARLVLNLFKFTDFARRSTQCAILYTVGQPGNKCLVRKNDVRDLTEQWEVYPFIEKQLLGTIRQLSSVEISQCDLGSGPTFYWAVITFQRRD